MGIGFATLILSLAAQTTNNLGRIIDLGVVSTRNAIVLEKRPDFAFFILHLLPQNWPTNMVSIVKTNDVLTLKDLDRVPSGDVVMEVKQISKDGAESPTLSFKFDVRRYDPEAVIYLTKDQQWQVVRALQEAERNAPPIPGETRPQPPPPPQSALPGGTNKSYAEHLHEMAEHFAKTGRRSE